MEKISPRQEVSREDENIERAAEREEVFKKGFMQRFAESAKKYPRLRKLTLISLASLKLLSTEAAAAEHGHLSSDSHAEIMLEAGDRQDMIAQKIETAGRVVREVRLNEAMILALEDATKNYSLQIGYTSNNDMREHQLTLEQEDLINLEHPFEIDGEIRLIQFLPSYERILETDINNMQATEKKIDGIRVFFGGDGLVRVYANGATNINNLSLNKLFETASPASLGDVFSDTGIDSVSIEEISFSIPENLINDPEFPKIAHGISQSSRTMHELFAESEEAPALRETKVYASQVTSAYFNKAKPSEIRVSTEALRDREILGSILRHELAHQYDTKIGITEGEGVAAESIKNEFTDYWTSLKSSRESNASFADFTESEFYKKEFGGHPEDSPHELFASIISIITNPSFAESIAKKSDDTKQRYREALNTMAKTLVNQDQAPGLQEKIQEILNLL